MDKEGTHPAEERPLQGDERKEIILTKDFEGWALR